MTGQAGQRVLCADALAGLKCQPAGAFRCCVTSPPYWGLRDYGVSDQLGAERSLDQYVERLVEVFREVRRTLADDGTLWLNLGDGYTSGDRKRRAWDPRNQARLMGYRPPTPEGLKPKDLLGVPWRVAFALQADGWWLRLDNIWEKPNAQPETARDRPSRSHEYLFLLSKSERYHYDREAVKEPAKSGKLRNRRSVWSVNTTAVPETNFATFPEELVTPCVLAGSEPGDEVLDPFFGSGTVGVVCIKHGRRFLGVELNPEYVALAKRRLERTVNNASVELEQASRRRNVELGRVPAGSELQRGR